MNITYKILISAILATITLTGAYAQKGPTGVIVSPAVKKEFANKIEALGTTKANESVIITADTTEKITGIHFEEGQDVKKDDLLVTLDKEEEEALLKAAKAELAQAQAAYNRAKDLQSTNALSKATLQERLAALQQSKSAVDSIQSLINELEVTAPFDGVLGLREVSLGALVQPGDTITTIDDLSQIKVDFEVPSVFLASLKPGLEVIGKVDAYPNKKFKGMVKTINTQIDPVTRTVRIRATLPNEDKILKPGLLMTITLETNARNALMIPEEALIKRNEKNFVYVAKKENGKTTAVETEITLGMREPGMIEVLSGLSEGDHVINHGTVKVRNGADIQIKAIEAEDAPLNQLLQQNKNGG
jgi:membrane fusion protein (multidrug efflux system)